MTDDTGFDRQWLIFEHLVWMSLVDGWVSPEEETLLAGWREKLGLSSDDQDALVAEFRAGREPPPPTDKERAEEVFLEVLELAASDTLEGEEERYLRQLASSFGLDAEHTNSLIESFRGFGSH